MKEKIDKAVEKVTGLGESFVDAIVEVTKKKKEA